MPNMEYESLPLDVPLVISMSLTLGENVTLGKNMQKIPMRRRVA
jgi:hypothetical protein